MSYLLTSEQSEKLLKNLSSKWSISDRYLKCIYKFKNYDNGIWAGALIIKKNSYSLKLIENCEYARYTPSSFVSTLFMSTLKDTLTLS